MLWKKETRWSSPLSTSEASCEVTAWSKETIAAIIITYDTHLPTIQTVRRFDIEAWTRFIFLIRSSIKARHFLPIHKRKCFNCNGCFSGSGIHHSSFGIRPLIDVKDAEVLQEDGNYNGHESWGSKVNYHLLKNEETKQRMMSNLLIYLPRRPIYTAR